MKGIQIRKNELSLFRQYDQVHRISQEINPPKTWFLTKDSLFQQMVLKKLGIHMVGGKKNELTSQHKQKLNQSDLMFDHRSTCKS